jgi:hypothetical protein
MNFLVIGVLVLAAAYVYRVKLDATVQAERLARLRSELRHERDKVAALRTASKHWPSDFCRCSLSLPRNSTRSIACRTAPRKTSRRVRIRSAE